MSAFDLDGALCVGSWDIFDSTDFYAHKVARAICADCPVVLACQVYAFDVLHGSATSTIYGIQGTWGGKLYGSRGRPRKEEAIA
jgi:hypothetical protein